VGRQTVVIDANGNRTETQYNLAGNVVKITSATVARKIMIVLSPKLPSSILCVPGVGICL